LLLRLDKVDEQRSISGRRGPSLLCCQNRELQWPGILGHGRAPGLDLEALRGTLASGQKRLRITTHAQVEAFKDGLDLEDLRRVLELGRAIEDYPERSRILLFGRTLGAEIPVHIIVEVGEGEVVIVSSYVPDSREWIRYVRRRRKRQ
jgi:hypothetical protein